MLLSFLFPKPVPEGKSTVTDDRMDDRKLRSAPITDAEEKTHLSVVDTEMFSSFPPFPSPNPAAYTTNSPLDSACTTSNTSIQSKSSASLASLTSLSSSSPASASNSQRRSVPPRTRLRKASIPTTPPAAPSSGKSASPPLQSPAIYEITPPTLSTENSTASLDSLDSQSQERRRSSQDSRRSSRTRSKSRTYEQALKIGEGAWEKTVSHENDEA